MRDPEAIACDALACALAHLRSCPGRCRDGARHAMHMTRDEARAECLRMLAKLDGVEVPNLLAGQPDDPGPFARTCLRCGLDEGLGENRLCARCCPHAPWWAHLCRWLPCVARRWFA